MPLSEGLRDALAGQLGLERSRVEIDEDGVVLNGELLASPGLQSLRTFLDGCSLVENTDQVVRIDDGSKVITIQRVVLRDFSQAGLFEIQTGAAWLFHGTFGSNTEAIDISACPGVMLALATLAPIRAENPVRNWSSLIESWGPLAISYAKISEATLAEIGCFCARSTIDVVQFQPLSAMKGFTARAETSDEAIQAYVLALEAQDGPDVTIHRLYRIFELEFAQSIKAEISNTPLNQVWKKLRNLRLSELVALEATVAKSPFQFSRFTWTDFESLFGTGHLPPEGGSYTLLRRWVDKKLTVHPVDGCRAHVIYYVRNALVHSKISEGDTLLLGPYEGIRAVALVNLAQDIHDLVRDIIAV